MLAALTTDEYPEYVRTEFRLLARARCEDPSATLQQLGNALGFTSQTICAWLRRPEYQRYEHWLVTKAFGELPPALRATRERVQEKFQEFAEEMQERLLCILDTTKDPKLQTVIAQDWLDRAGHSPVRKQMNAGFQVNLTPELVEQMRMREVEAFATATADGHPAD